MGWTVCCGWPPLLLPSCRKLEFRLSSLMDSDLAWVNGKSGRQSWRFPALYNIGSHLPFIYLFTNLTSQQDCCTSHQPLRHVTSWPNTRTSVQLTCGCLVWETLWHVVLVYEATRMCSLLSADDQWRLVAVSLPPVPPLLLTVNQAIQSTNFCSGLSNSSYC